MMSGYCEGLDIDHIVVIARLTGVTFQRLDVVCCELVLGIICCEFALLIYCD